MIDPSKCEPWRHLDLDVDTGILAPRYTTAGVDRKGRETVDALDTLNDESVSEARLAYIDMLRKAMGEAADVTDIAARRRLIDHIKRDELGLAKWFLAFGGANEEFARDFRGHNPELWHRLLVVAFRTRG